MFYVQVIGPYDSTFVGPFDSRDDAAAYAATINPRVFNACVMTDAERRANVDEFGPCDVTPPEERA